MKSQAPRLLVIGLDGYDPDLAARLIADGQLPHLAALMSEAAVVPLEHGAARRTGLAWEHFASGKTPQAANRFSAVDFDAAAYTCTQRSTTLAPFTESLGASAVIFDAPYFDLSRSGGARGLVGWGAHDPGVPEHSVPGGLSAEVRKRFGDYPATQWIYGHTWPDAEACERMGRDLVQAVECRSAISHWLLGERCADWRLGMVVISELHSATEALWHGVDESHPLAVLPSAHPAGAALRATYAAVDRMLGELRARFPDATLLAFTPHGMGPNHSDTTSMALLPELLYRRSTGRQMLTPGTVHDSSGLVMPATVDEPWSASMRTRYPAAVAAQRRSPGWRRRLRRELRSLRRRWAPTAGTANASLGWMPASWYQPHWESMDAFALPSFYDGQLRVNLQGRETKGRVDPNDYEALIADLETMLWACTNPRTGRCAVAEVLRNPRPAASLGPTDADLIVVWSDTADALAHPQYGTLGPVPLRRPGGHTGGQGIALLAGAAVTPGPRAVRSAFDVVPTVLDLLDVAVPPDLSGSSFRALLQS